MLLGSSCVKAVHKHVDEIEPWPDQFLTLIWFILNSSNKLKLILLLHHQEDTKFSTLNLHNVKDIYHIFLKKINDCLC